MIVIKKASYIDMRLRKLEVLGLSLLLVGMLAGCQSLAETAPSASQTLEAPIKANTGVVAEGHILPRANVSLSPGIGGQVVQLLVAEGDAVKPGQVLVQLDDAQLRAAVAEAESNLQVAQARLAQTKAGATAEQVAVAEAAVAVAASGVKSAEGAVASARANLARIQSGPTAEELAIAQHRIEAAKNALWSSQAQRDLICGQPSKASCDGAQAAVQQADEGVRIAELQLQQLQRGASQQEVAMAEAQVQQTLGQLEGAKSGLAQAQASLAEVKKGTPQEAIAVVAAQAAQAQTAVERAKVALVDTQLRAPMSGQVVSLDTKLGERVTPGTPIVQLADLSTWQVETKDLTEIEVVHVAVGQKVTIIPDALPDAQLTGTVEAIHDVFEEKRGDVTYTVRIRFANDADLPLRWGMTVKVRFDQTGQ
jgi:HlyD family secretion protein